jgi:hypothetical protein
MKRIIFIIVMAGVIIGLVSYFSLSRSSSDQTQAIRQAKKLFTQQKELGIDMANGPCLGQVWEDWVLDIAHKPRQAVDDEPQNQCLEYTLGKVHHFVELDPEGNFIRAE